MICLCLLACLLNIDSEINMFKPKKTIEYNIKYLLRDLIPSLGEVRLSKFYCLPSEKESALTRKTFCGIGLFPVRADPFSEGTLCTGEKKHCLPSKNCGQFIIRIQSP